MEQAAFNDWRLVALTPLPAWALVLLGVAAVVALWSAWRGLKVESRKSRRRVLLGLRAAAAVVVLLLVLEPGIELLATSPIKGRVAVLVDTSRSMQLPARVSGPSRADAVKARLSDGTDRQALEDRFQVDWYGFSGLVAPSDPSALVLAGADGQRQPQDDRTLLLPALEEAARAAGGRPLAGVVVLSDGADNGALAQAVSAGTKSEESKAIVERLEALGTPVFTLDPSSGDIKDVAIGQVKADDFAFVRNSVDIDVEIVQRGYGRLDAPVVLERDGQVVVQAQLTATENEAGRATLSFTPDTTGEFTYTVRTPVQAGEAVTTNNARSFVLKVIRDRVRVLHVAGKPSWDERFLRQLLKRDPNVDLISFFILRTPTDLQVGGNEELSLIPFPTDEIFRKQLDTFDLVVFHDFTYQPYRMAHYLPGIAQYVQDGGAFLMLGGETSFAEGRYANTAIADILPVRLDSHALPPSDTPFTPTLTEHGRRHPITALAPGDSRNIEAWARLPVLRGINRTTLREDSQALLSHPELTDATGQPAPVVAVREVGRGRSLAITTDSTWEWAFAGAHAGKPPRAYEDFFQHAIRWLVRDPELTQVRLQAEKDVFHPGEPVALVAHVRDRDYRPAEGAQVTLELSEARSGSPGPSLSGVVDAEGLARLEAASLPEGPWRAKVTATLDGRALGDATDAFIVQEQGPELGLPLPRPDVLRLVASATGGQYHSMASTRLSELPFKDPKLVEIGQRRSEPLWDKAWVLVVLCLLLGSEWLLRRRWGFF